MSMAIAAPRVKKKRKKKKKKKKKGKGGSSPVHLGRVRLWEVWPSYGRVHPAVKGG